MPCAPSSTRRGVQLTPPARRVDLACRITGSGPPLVLVHGVAADADSFRLLEPHLAIRFTVVSVDRRGRCGSPDDGVYSLESEFEDVVGVVESMHEPAVVFGHSFGGNVALGAAMRTSRIAKLVLYEAGRRGDAPAELRTRLEGLLQRGERKAAMRLVLLEFARSPEEWLDELLDTPPWEARLAYAHTLARELRAYEEHDYGDLSRLRTPTLLLVGVRVRPRSWSMPSLARVLPQAHVVLLDGVGHIGPVTDPALVANEIVDFVGVDTST